MTLGLGLGGNAGVPVPYLQMTLPSGFTDRWSPPMTFFESAGGQYLTNYDLTTLKPSISKTYWVKSTGSDAAAGTEGAPLLSLSVALAKSDVDEVIIDTSAGDYIMPSTRGWGNTQPSRDVSVRVTGPGRAISTAANSATFPTWVPVSGAIYKTTTAAANAYGIIDSFIRESDGFFNRPLVAASVVAMTAGTYFHDGTDLYVWALDSRSLVGDQRMLISGSNSNLRIPSANRTIYVDGVDFIGGLPLNYVSAGVVDPLFVGLNCTFQGSHSNGSTNSVNITGPGRFYFHRCGAARGWRDQFNYHGNANGDPRFFENECYTGLGGYVGTSDNASTSHENAAGIRLNGRYGNSLNRTIADINDTRTMILGGTIGQARTAAVANESVAQQNTNQTWMGGVSIPTGSNPQIVIINTATVATRKMTAPTRAGTGEDAGTLTTW
jgi:hypothetical protein